MMSEISRFRDILKILAQHQLDNPGEFGPTMEILFEKAREKMIVSNIKQLKECLVEGKDHKIITEKEESDGKVHIILVAPQATLERLVGGLLE